MSEIKFLLVVFLVYASLSAVVLAAALLHLWHEHGLWPFYTIDRRKDE